MPAPATYQRRPYLAQCPGCEVYAAYLVERGEGWALIHCPLCGPVRLARQGAGPPPWSVLPPYGAPYGRRRRQEG